MATLTVLEGHGLPIVYGNIAPVILGEDVVILGKVPRWLKPSKKLVKFAKSLPGKQILILGLAAASTLIPGVGPIVAGALVKAALIKDKTGKILKAVTNIGLKKAAKQNPKLAAQATKQITADIAPVKPAGGAAAILPIAAIAAMSFMGE
jgi:hypothetical protein